MRLLWRGLVGRSLVRRWRSHWLLIWGRWGNSLPAYFAAALFRCPVALVRLPVASGRLPPGLPVAKLASHSVAFAFGAVLRFRAGSAHLAQRPEPYFGRRWRFPAAVDRPKPAGRPPESRDETLQVLVLRHLKERRRPF